MAGHRGWIVALIVIALTLGALYFVIRTAVIHAIVATRETVQETART